MPFARRASKILYAIQSHIGSAELYRASLLMLLGLIIFLVLLVNCNHEQVGSAPPDIMVRLNRAGQRVVEAFTLPKEEGELKPVDMPKEAGGLKPVGMPKEEGGLKPVGMPKEEGGLKPVGMPKEEGGLKPVGMPKEEGGLKPVGCRDALSRSIYGEWVPRAYAPEEFSVIEEFLNKTRSFHRIPYTLQRKDGLCGEYYFSNTKMHPYRALCDYKGPTPCCHSNHTCVALSEELCQCEGCYDNRRPVHAELADWVISDKTCTLNTYIGEEEMCPVLRNTIVHVMGDSFTRQLYIALLAAIRDGHPDHIFAHTNTNTSTINLCDPYFTYFRTCKLLIPTNVTACNGSLSLRFSHMLTMYYNARQILTTVKQYMGVPNTVVVLWIGAWDHYDSRLVIDQLITPLGELLASSSWPHLIWVSAHSPGLLKRLPHPNETPDGVLRFNRDVKCAFWGTVPILDTFPLTKDARVASYDGAHYGPGVNGLKVRILMNYFNELRHQGTFL